MKTILVTGAQGAIGRPLCAALDESGLAIRMFDLRTELCGGRREDIRDPESVAEALRGCRGIIHLAAVSRVGAAEQHPGRCWETNVSGTENVIRAALAREARPWLLFASSREVYGQARSLPVGERTPLLPLNHYGRSKLAGEWAVAVAQHAGLRAAIVRLPNVYGSPADHPDRLIPALIAAAQRGYTLTVAGPERQFDFIHVDDAVNAISTAIRLLDAGTHLATPIALGTGEPITLAELARSIQNLTGHRGRVRYVHAGSHEVTEYWADPAMAASHMNWRARITLEHGLTAMILGTEPQRMVNCRAAEEGAQS